MFLEIERERRVEPSCIILDVNMPGLNGLEVQSKLREDLSEVPIVFLTAHADVPSSVRAIKAGAVDFLTKPFDPDTLLSTVEAAVRRNSSSSLPCRA